MPKAKKRPLGRPPVPDEDRRSTLIRVLVTKDEHAKLRRAAEAGSASVSAWVRAAALEKSRLSEIHPQSAKGADRGDRS